MVFDGFEFTPSYLHYTLQMMMDLKDFLFIFHRFWIAVILLADRTIGRAFGTMCRLSVCL